MKRKIKALNLKLVAHEDLYDFLATRSDAEITMILDRIKGGMDIASLHTLIRDGEVLLQFAQPAEHLTEPREIPPVPAKRLKSQSSHQNLVVKGETNGESNAESSSGRISRVPISALLQNDQDT